jgi:peroxin-14
MSEQPISSTEQNTSATPTTTTTTSAKEETIKKAVAFLKNVQVARAPLMRRVNFLMSKGLNSQEILEAFIQAGMTNVTLKEIQDIVERKVEAAPLPTTTTTPAAPAPPTYNSPSAPPPSYQPQQQYYAPQHQSYPQYHHQAAIPPPPPQQHYYPQQQHYNDPHQHAPYDNQHHQHPHESSWDWKDYFIATTVAIGGLFGAYKAFEHFSPFTVVRKDELQQQQQMFGTRLPPPPTTTNSFSNFTPVTQQQQQTSLSAVFPSPAETNNSNNKPAEPPKTESEIVKAKDEEIAKLKADLETLQKDLDETRKKHSMSALQIGQHKGQIQNLNAAVERVKREKESLVEENTLLKQRNEFFEKQVKSKFTDEKQQSEGEQPQQQEEKTTPEKKEDQQQQEQITSTNNENNTITPLKEVVETAIKNATVSTPEKS